jgi:cytochrome c2
LCLSCHPTHYTERKGCTGCHRGNPDSDRKNIAHHRLIAGRFAHFTLGDAVLKEGERLMVRYACRRCHVSDGRGNRLATPLDNLISTRTAEEVASALRSPAQGMPDFRLTEKQVVPLVNAILSGAGQGRVKGVERPMVLHFMPGQQRSEDVFTRRCGPCHRAITERRGLLGTGNIGPNLSGLLSEWYPRTFGDRQAWTAERLRRWLNNPRTVLPGARMPPVDLSAEEFRELAGILEVFRSD